MTNVKSTRAALYSRVAANNQMAGSVSIRDQVLQLESFCAFKGWRVVAKFADTGSGANASRPGFEEMIAAPDGGEPQVDVIVLHSMSLFPEARSFGSARGELFGGPDCSDAAIGEILATPMIETAQALDNIDEFLEVLGVDLIYVGPNDLARDLGRNPGPN